MSEISGNVMFVLLNANVQHLVVIVILFPFHYKQLLFHQLVYKNHELYKYTNARSAVQNRCAYSMGEVG